MAKQSRTYTFPGNYTDKKPATEKDKVTIRELSVEEQLQVAKDFDGVRLMQEMYKRALVNVRGVPCNSENRDTEWSHLASKERDLIARAYRTMHVASDKEETDFFASAEIVATA